MSNSIKTRIQLKVDTPELWDKVSDPTQVANVFYPLKGEPIFYEIDDGNGNISVKMKLGDGKHTAKDLPFVGEGSDDVTFEVATDEEIKALFNDFPSFAYVPATDDDIGSLFADW